LRIGNPPEGSQPSSELSNTKTETFPRSIGLGVPERKRTLPLNAQQIPTSPRETSRIPSRRCWTAHRRESLPDATTGPAAGPARVVLALPRRERDADGSVQHCQGDACTFRRYS
jgi:hypothetical protein